MHWKLKLAQTVYLISLNKTIWKCFESRAGDKLEIKLEEIVEERGYWEKLMKIKVWQF